MTDATPVIAVYESPTQGGGSCGIYVAWEDQGPPLVDHWDVRNTMHHAGIALIYAPGGAEIWRATVPALTEQTFVAAQVVPGHSINWRRATKQNTYAFSLSG